MQRENRYNFKTGKGNNKHSGNYTVKLLQATYQ